MSQDSKFNSTSKSSNDPDYVEGQEGRPEAINRLVEVTSKRNLMALTAAIDALPEVSGRKTLDAAVDMRGIANRLLRATEDFMETLPDKATPRH